MSKLRLPRLAEALIASVILFILTTIAADQLPTSHLAVSLYKLHLCSLAGWAGYWLDRFLFPYSRPHEFFEQIEDAFDHGSPNVSAGHDNVEGQICGTLDSAEQAMFRRAIIVAACLICVGLGA
jgi:hypothetical protein